MNAWYDIASLDALYKQQDDVKGFEQSSDQLRLLVDIHSSVKRGPFDLWICHLSAISAISAISKLVDLLILFGKTAKLC